MRAYPMTIRRASVAVVALLVCGAVLADDDKSITQRLIEADGKVALQKLEQDLAKSAPAPALTAAPAGATTVKARERSPQTIALYGVDGRAAGGAMSLRSYVRWGDQVYPARVGAKWRGFTVADISGAGTTFTRGKTKVFAPLVQEDAAVLLDAGRVGGPEAAARPAAPLPAQVPAMAPGFPTAPQMPMPQPAFQPPVPTRPMAAPASVAQR
ncbi:hypothetical protein [Cupriavidus sp. D39]|uniref:hypothetical protein n=1 Tax=Cupriavidus sp. D39 TaxID=2997877 RepID=UPI00227183FB|nr:hypothetical protein [Cupriavidus sp. D39]MCY0853403.1 hypothetical protein [Cupriavidus sp. D39]